MKKTEGYSAVLGFSVGGRYRCINSNSPEKFAIMKYSFTKPINIAVRLLGPPRAEDLVLPPCDDVSPLYNLQIYIKYNTIYRSIYINNIYI